MNRRTLVEDLEEAVYRLACARPHEPEDAHYTPEQWRFYSEGYYYALAFALRAMRFALERRARREQEARQKARASVVVGVVAGDALFNDVGKKVRVIVDELLEHKGQRARSVKRKLEVITTLRQRVDAGAGNKPRLGVQLEVPVNTVECSQASHSAESSPEKTAAQPHTVAHSVSQSDGAAAGVSPAVACGVTSHRSSSHQGSKNRRRKTPK